MPRSKSIWPSRSWSAWPSRSWSAPTPPDLSSNRVLVAMGLAGLGGAALALLAGMTRGRLTWPCLWHAITGLECPFCGTTRMTMALLHGDLVDAVRCNAPVLAIGGLLVLLWAGWMLQWLGFARPRRLLPGPSGRRWVLLTLVGGAAVFTVVRNLPWPAFAALSS